MAYPPPPYIPPIIPPALFASPAPLTVAPAAASSEITRAALSDRSVRCAEEEAAEAALVPGASSDLPEVAVEAGGEDAGGAPPTSVDIAAEVGGAAEAAAPIAPTLEGRSRAWAPGDDGRWETLGGIVRALL
mmetsp:Transcript_46711/g.141529  ORF Transcript_46711/g.141529 Transcript_46711/m.141529 type:complete len:132 (-) Transcript_46711:10-405(-)